MNLLGILKSACEHYRPSAQVDLIEKAHRAVGAQFPDRRVVCLCGSTRYFELFMQANAEYSLQGCLVLTVGFFGHRPESPGWRSIDDDDKANLDALHFDKIRLCDEVVVIGEHRGESLTRELALAEELGKKVSIYQE